MIVEDLECPIWGTRATVHSDQYHDDIHSPRTGGKYRHKGVTRSELRDLSVSQKVALTRWLVRQREMGTAVPTITRDIFDYAKIAPFSSFSERVDSVLLQLSKINPRLGAIIEFKEATNSDTDEKFGMLMAATECRDRPELMSLIGMMHAQGLVKHAPNVGTSNRFELCPAGWERLDRLQTISTPTRQAFVAMWFDSSMDEAFKDAVDPAIRQCGYEPFRIDRKQHINRVDDEIIAEIRRSRFAVCDFTCKPRQPRGGVYFEAGYAMGRGIPVIWSCREDAMDDLHFDTRQFNHIKWTSIADLKKQLADRIGSVIGDGPILADNKR